MTDREGKPPGKGAAHLEQYRFKPGQAPISPGRPRGSGLAASIRRRSNEGEKYLDILEEIASDPYARNADRVRCIELLLERGYGKVLQTSATVSLEGDAAVAVLEALNGLQTGDLERLARGQTVDALPTGDQGGHQIEAPSEQVPVIAPETDAEPTD